MTKALIIIDMLKDFATPGGKLYCSTANSIIPNIQKLMDAFADKNLPIILSCDYHFKNDPELKLWEPHAMKGTDGANLVQDLTLKSNKAGYAPKHWYSGFTETKLEKLLRDMGIDELIITGMHTNICVRHTCYDAYVKGFAITVVKDATGTFTEDEHILGLEYLKSVYGAILKTTDEILKEVKQR